MQSIRVCHRARRAVNRVGIHSHTMWEYHVTPTQLLGRSGIETAALGVGGHLGLLTDSNDPAQRRAEAIRAVRRATGLGVR